MKSISPKPVAKQTWSQIVFFESNVPESSFNVSLWRERERSLKDSLLSPRPTKFDERALGALERHDIDKEGVRWGILISIPVSHIQYKQSSRVPSNGTRDELKGKLGRKWCFRQ